MPLRPTLPAPLHGEVRRSLRQRPNRRPMAASVAATKKVFSGGGGGLPVQATAAGGVA
ncbi:hypothetical protein QJS04_geneDACA021406 [Acorus gramineus]|uniref:Uncharacterized protein n=1 Tax=Acorus gramineus TaxID=55184 RepID=A0AAV9A5R4_ACOGR|nr:hypothetical protein QJS04_geneDACA021406 [Acorus gramineus]